MGLAQRMKLVMRSNPIYATYLGVLLGIINVCVSTASKSRDGSDNCGVSDELCDCFINGSDVGELFVPGDYNKAQIPRMGFDNMGKLLPLKVYFAASVQTIAPIVVAATEFRIKMKLILKWTDWRLRTCNNISSLQPPKTLFLPVEKSHLIWLPSPYISNAKYEEIQRLERELMSVSISNAGLVTFTFVMNATVCCAMNFKWYPLDSQICPLRIESFSHDESFVDYDWLPNKPFEILPKRLLQFDVSHDLVYRKSHSVRMHIGGNYTELIVYFRFNRLLENYMIQNFVPVCLLVILSWFSFWLELDVTAARASLLMTVMLTLVTLISSLRTELPPVAYVKGVDIWIFGCMLAIFGAMAEFALVKVLYSITEEIRRQNRVETLWRRNDGENENFMFYPQEISQQHTLWAIAMPMPSYRKKRLGSVVLSGRSVATSHLPQIDWHTIFGIRIPLVWTRFQDDADGSSSSSTRKYVLWREIDNVSKLLFPTLFFLFTICYWIILIVFSKMELDSI
ncbi:unnamed protein product [Orchesella dallaii]|uniref:Glycine receptor subunit alphaZ1 n=1 Tax=Orchesella dallaii TaxID=48710 RepID=A0ABP1QJC4_9HEXA